MTSSADRPVAIDGQARPRRFRLQATAELAWSAVAAASRRPADPRLIVLGNQKAGTSVVAGAIGEAVGLPYQIDLPIERFQPTYHTHPVTDPDYPTRLLQRSRHRFDRPVVKEPSLTFWWRHLAERWPSARIVFVVRDPLDNIRSILDRLHVLDPDTRAGPDCPGPMTLPFPWLHLAQLEDAPVADRPIVRSLDDLVDSLARRWRLCAVETLAGVDAGHDVLRYEDFLADPDGSLAALGLPDVPPTVLDRSFQPRGANRDRDATVLLASWTPKLWGKIAPLAGRFGYSADRKSAPIRRIPEPTKPCDLALGTVRRGAPARSPSRTWPGGVVAPNDRARSSGKGAWT